MEIISSSDTDSNKNGVRIVSVVSLIQKENNECKPFALKRLI
jgi:hypothetical protein